MTRWMLFLPFMVFGVAHAEIQKCQDEAGNWHYGDFAIDACNASKVTTMDQRGVVTDERPAPKTDAELAAEADAMRLQEAQAAQAKAEREERARILSIYETEADIVRQRDNQLASVQSNIDVHEAYLESLAERIQREQRQLETEQRTFKRNELTESIEQASRSQTVYGDRLAALRQQKQEVVSRFEREIKVYRELTSVPSE